MNVNQLIREGAACAGVGLGLLATGMSLGRIDTLALMVSIAAAKVISNFIDPILCGDNVGHRVFKEYSTSLTDRGEVIGGKHIFSHILGAALTITVLVKMELIKAAFLTYPTFIVGGLVLYAAPKLLNLALSPLNNFYPR